MLVSGHDEAALAFVFGEVGGGFGNILRVRNFFPKTGADTHHDIDAVGGERVGSVSERLKCLLLIGGSIHIEGHKQVLSGTKSKDSRLHSHAF